MTERILTAMYDTRAAAETARDDLVALGIPSGDVTIRGTEGGATATSDASEDKGFWGSLADLFMPDEDRHAYAEGMRRGNHLLTARVPESMVDRGLEVLERHDPIDIDEQAGTSTAAAATGGSTAAYTSAADRSSSTARAESLRTGTAEGEEAIPVVGEEVRVGKREVGRGGVRVRSYVRERPVEEQVNLREERVQVERRPVDRPLEAGDAAFQEREIEAVERGEEAVVDKQARVKEEVAIRKDVDTRTETVRDTVRETEVEVEDERADRGVTGTEEVTTTRDRGER